MPDDVRAAIDRAAVRGDFDDRPAHQRNDYVGWITGARGDATRARRIARMIDELRAGGVYMGMAHRPSRKG